MEYTFLGRTGLSVSRLCLGTMNFGPHTDEKTSFKIMDNAIDHGINFFDTANVYGNFGGTETIIGKWFSKGGSRREKIVLATKVYGGSAEGWYGWPKNWPNTSKLSAKHIISACNESLKRLQTDYIDLYQLHWPERNTNTFGVRDYKHVEDKWEDNFNQILHTLDEIIKSGKIRQVGISNEKAWGTMRYLEESKHHNLPRMITIQNAYSLLNRVFEGDMAEIAIREQIGLLAYSPMAFGVLSGKYIKGTAGDNARLKLFPRFARYSSEQSTEATKGYLKIAEQHNITLAQLSLAFVTSRPFITSNIIGATSMLQLKENIDSINVTLNQDVLDAIEKVHNNIPNPAP